MSSPPSGGKQELGETAEQALHREMKEETGLEVTMRGLITVVDLFGCNDASKTWCPREMQTEELSYHFIVVEYLSTVPPAAQGTLYPAIF